MRNVISRQNKILVERGIRFAGSHFRVPCYSPWAPWGECRGGRRSRRRHCLRREVCGDAVRIEVSRCARHFYNFVFVCKQEVAFEMKMSFGTVNKKLQTEIAVLLLSRNLATFFYEQNCGLRKSSSLLAPKCYYR